MARHSASWTVQPRCSSLRSLPRKCSIIRVALVPAFFPALDAGWQAEMLKEELPERSQEGQKELTYV